MSNKLGLTAPVSRRHNGREIHLASPQEADVRTQDDVNNRANQLNPNNLEYWKLRGWRKRPEDWKRRAAVQDVAPPKRRSEREKRAR